MVDKTKIEQVVADTMAANENLEGIVVCNAKGEVLFGHTIAAGVKHADVASLAVKIASNSSQLAGGLDKGGLKEVSLLKNHYFAKRVPDRLQLTLYFYAFGAKRVGLPVFRFPVLQVFFQVFEIKIEGFGIGQCHVFCFQVFSGQRDNFKH